MNAKQLRTDLKEIVSSTRWINIHGTDRQRLVFDDERAWDWFHQALEPYNDYSYLWLRDALEAISAHLADHDHLQEFDVAEHLEASISVYTSDLTAWLADRNTNLAYLTLALQESDWQDGFQLLSRAQALALEEVFFQAVDRCCELLEEKG